MLSSEVSLFDSDTTTDWVTSESVRRHKARRRAERSFPDALLAERQRQSGSQQQTLFERFHESGITENPTRTSSRAEANAIHHPVPRTVKGPESDARTVRKSLTSAFRTFQISLDSNIGVFPGPAINGSDRVDDFRQRHRAMFRCRPISRIHQRHRLQIVVAADRRLACSSRRGAVAPSGRRTRRGTRLPSIAARSSGRRRGRVVV